MASRVARGRCGMIRASSAWRTPAGTSAAIGPLAGRGAAIHRRATCRVAARPTPGPTGQAAVCVSGRISRRAGAARPRPARM